MFLIQPRRQCQRPALNFSLGRNLIPMGEDPLFVPPLVYVASMYIVFTRRGERRGAHTPLDVKIHPLVPKYIPRVESMLTQLASFRTCM
jgi:hypothetical protein